MKRLVKVIDSINIRTGKFAGYLGIVIAGIIVYEIILRSFFNKPTIWAHETSGMMFGALFMLGAGYVLYHGEHVKVDILISRLRPRVQALIDIITHLLLWLYGSVVLWKSSYFALRAFVRMEMSASGWQPVLWPIKFVIVIGIILLMLQLVAKYIRDFHMLFTGKELQ